MKKLVVMAAAFGMVLAGATAQAAMSPAPLLGNSSSDIQKAGVICGPGFHLVGVVCVRNVAVKVCPVGWRLGPAGVCRRI